jgi:hypothetical protein
MLAICSGLGIALALLMARHHQARPRAIDRAAAAASTSHTIPVRPSAPRSDSGQAATRDPEPTTPATLLDQ